MATGLVQPVPAAAQDPGPVRLTLAGQSPVVTEGRPFRAQVRATNEGSDALRDLVLSVWIYNTVDSRSAYRLGLRGEPPSAPLRITPEIKEGDLAPGETRTFRLEQKLPELGALGENALYPVKIQLESAGVAVAALRSAVVFIGEEPVVPLNVSLVFVLDVPISLRPAGTFRDDRLERAIAPGGSVDTIVSALEARPIRTTLVVSPILLEQLRRMSDGYRVVMPVGYRRVAPGSGPARQAAGMLSRIRQVARSPGTEVVALPYAAPSVPSLVEAGLSSDLEAQMARGREAISAMLGVTPADRVFRPPGSVLSQAGLAALAGIGVRTLILDADSFPSPAGKFSPKATGLVWDGPGGHIGATAPDPGLDAYLNPPPDDPVLRAQQWIGELSAMYFELPSKVRGATVVFGEDDAPDPLFLDQLLKPLSDPPARSAWLRPKSITQLVEAVPPGEGRRRVRMKPFRSFSSRFAARIRSAEASIDQFETMTEEAAPLARRLRTLLFLSESRQFLASEAEGLRFLAAVNRSLRREFDKIETPSGGSISLTSRGGVIPVTLRSLADYDVRVRVTLLSPRLEFPDGRSREILLSEPGAALTFPVRAQTTGRFPVSILIDTPGGHRIGESHIVVRSTAYNRVALVVTIGAALFLAAWWGRRFLRRKI